LARDSILFICPITEVNELAAFTAKGSIRVIDRVGGDFSTMWALNLAHKKQDNGKVQKRKQAT